METTYIILIALAIIYVPLYLYIRYNKKMEEKGLLPYGPCIMLRTKVGLKLIDRLGRYVRFWRVCGILSRIITIILMVYIVAIIIIDLLLLPQAFGKSGRGIEYALAIPGLNPMLPIVYGWIGLIVAMVFHEMAHGIQSRANDIKVDYTGLLYAVVPVGAFVEPNEEEIEKASRGARMDLYAAGITTNFIIAMVTFILMFAMVSGTLSSDYEDSPAIYGITSNSPLADSDIPATAIILQIDDTPVNTPDELYDSITVYGVHNIRYLYKGEEFVKTDVPLGTFVNTVVSDSPISGTGIEKGDFLIKIDDHDIGSPTSMTEYLKDTTPGQTVTVTYLDRSEDYAVKTTDPFELGDNDGKGYLGVSTTLSGLSITTPSIIMNNGVNPYYGADSVSAYVNGTISYLAKAFNGFSPVPESTHWWYNGSFINDNITWIVIQMLYWIFWLNIVLGVTNALPAVPFDGGFLFAGGVDYITERFVKDEKKREKIVDTIASGTTYFMLLALVVVMLVIVI